MTVQKGSESNSLRTYKRSPALSNSTWYKGIICSQMARTPDNNGGFDTIVSKMRRGTEPPPHVHSREDEVFYMLSGEMRVYAGGEVLQVTAKECMYLPHRNSMHSRLRLRLMSSSLSRLAAFVDAISKMNAPAERMEVPTDVDTVIYATADLTDTMKVFEEYGYGF